MKRVRRIALGLAGALLGALALTRVASVDRDAEPCRAPQAAGGPPSALSASAGAGGGTRAQVLLPLRVTVHDSGGQPVVGTHVNAVPCSSDPGGGQREGRTDAAGATQLLLPVVEKPWLVLANWTVCTHAALARGAVTVAAGGEPTATCSIVLECLCARLDVQVTDDLGTPISGACIAANFEDLQLLTDEHGTARFAALPAGWRPIDLRAGAGMRTDVAVPTPSRRSVRLESGGHATLTFVLPRRASLTVRLPPECSGEPDVVTEVLSASGAEHREARLEDGRARFDGLPPGDYTVAARFGDGSHLDASERQAVVLTAGAGTECVLRPRRLEGILSGRVVDDAAQPVAGALVCARTASRRPMPMLEKRTLSDAAGYFVLRGLPRAEIECSVLVEAITGCDYAYLGGDVRWVTMAQPGEGVVLRLRRSPRVSGRVVDELSRPVTDETVFLQREGFSVERRTQTARGDAVATGLAAGGFEFRHLAPGTYRVWVGDGDRRDGRVIVVAEAAGACVPVADLVLRRRP